MKNDALDVTKPDEYLYGRAGYLYSLMYLREQIRSDIIDAQLITDVNSLQKMFTLLQIDVSLSARYSSR
jgi:hypothetical protein